MHMQEAVCRLGQAGTVLGEPSKDVRQVRIAAERLGEEFPEILQCIWDTLEEVRTLFNAPPETVCTQDLERAEQHESAEPLAEGIPVDGYQLLQRIEVRVDESALEILRISGARLPHE